jgi:cytochrome c oxidase cbb3-type subunit III
MSKSKKHDPIQGEIVHVYDGIEEADNRLPQWWLMTFYSAILFSIGYWFYYEEFEAGPGPLASYLAEKAVNDEKNGVDPSADELLALSSGPTRELGQKLFAANCVACHADQGQGTIGPNLTDGAWLHGSDPLAIFKTVRDGVPAKGMPAWGQTLGRSGVSQLAAFILTLRNTNVPGKAPEGQIESALGGGERGTRASTAP